MEIKESVGIVGNDKGVAELIGSVFGSNGYLVWSVMMRSAKRELKKRLATCRIVVFDVENEDKYKKEARKRHALIRGIKAIEPRIEIVCVIHEPLCAGKGCKMGCAKVTCKNRSLAMFRSEIEQVIRRVELKVW